MQARLCRCPHPRVFADSPETCQRCGRSSRGQVPASTLKVAIAIAEVALGYRKLANNGKIAYPSADIAPTPGLFQHAQDDEVGQAA